MVPGSGYNSYRNQFYEGMDPKRLVLMLYEGAIKFLRLAQEGIKENNLNKRGENLSRAIAIVAELNASLDSNVRDEATDFLRGLYNAILTELPKVSLNNDIKTVELAMAYMERLREIWMTNVMGLNKTPLQDTPEASQDVGEGGTVPRNTPQKPVHSMYSDNGGQRGHSITV